MTKIKSFKDLELDQSKLSYFKQYLDKNYNDKFRYGQGTEQILKLLSKYGQGGHWIDLGAGTSSLFWSIPLENISSCSCCDKYAEALKVLNDFLKSGETPQCYYEALQMFEKPVTHLAKMREKFKNYYVFDVMKPWPAYLELVQYDLITEFGTFGLAPSSKHYANCFNQVVRHLKKGKRVIGANWIRSQKLVEKEGHDNSYLSGSLIEKTSRQVGLNLLALEKVDISDSNYSSVIMFVMEK